MKISCRNGFSNLSAGLSENRSLFAIFRALTPLYDALINMGTHYDAHIMMGSLATTNPTEVEE